MECAITLATVAVKVRAAMHRGQLLGQLPWASDLTGDIEEAKTSWTERTARGEAWDKVPPELRRDDTKNAVIIPDPRHEVQEQGGFVDFWYLDDGDVLCDPRLAVAYLRHFDAVNREVGAVRNKEKTEAIFYATEAEMEEHADEWGLAELGAEAALSSATCGSITLGVTVGPAEAVDR